MAFTRSGVRLPLAPPVAIDVIKFFLSFQIIPMFLPVPRPALAVAAGAFAGCQGLKAFPLPLRAMLVKL
jgi:hypothetical protein